MNGPQNLFRTLGLVAVAVGVILLMFAYSASNAPVDQIANTLTGHFTDNTMLYLIGGVAALVAGGALVMSGK